MLPVWCITILLVSATSGRDSPLPRAVRQIGPGSFTGGSTGSSTGTGTSSGGSGGTISGPISGPGPGPGPGPMMPPHNPTSIHHVGVSYNLLKGNPDGEYWSTGGEDPGVTLTRKIFTVSAVDNPPEIKMEHHDGCQYSHGFYLFYDTKSYQSKLYTNVHTSGAADDALKPFGFTLSSGYQAVAQQTNHHHYVFQDATTYCKMGYVRYSLALAAADRYPVTREFAQHACALPTTYDATQYMKFIDTWGTHVMTEITIGRLQTSRYEAPLRNLFNFVMFNVTDEITLGGAVLGYPKSYVIDPNSFKYRHEYHYIVGVFEDMLTVGDMYSKDIIGKTMITLDIALDAKYWQFAQYYVSQHLCPSDVANKLSVWKTNLIQALKAYPAYKRATAPADAPLAMPQTWPLGTYSLPKPSSGCPSGFMEGSINLAQPHGHAPTGLNLDGQLTSSKYNLHFCTKEDPQPTKFDIYWPRGDYCIYQYDHYCPYGFMDGSVTVSSPTATTKTGIVPSGTYDVTTTMHFCCRNDTVYSHKMFLPNSQPFYLFRYQHGCQQVHGMTVAEQTLTFTNTIQSNGMDGQTGVTSFTPAIDAVGVTTMGARQYTLHYCYYTVITK